jgi:predicted Rossmann-fold nucleotide-binding protein
MSKRVVICGGRGYDNAELLGRKLDELHAEHEFCDLMQGGAYGADRLAKIWAMGHPEIVLWQINAEWSKFGLGAGTIRNRRMMEWKPDLVVVFPGGKGTANMKEQARLAGVEIIEVKA